MMSCKVIFTNESIRTTIESNQVDWSWSEVCFRICSFVRLVWINKLTMSRIEKARWSFVSISSVQFISLGWSLCEHLFIHSFIGCVLLFMESSHASFSFIQTGCVFGASEIRARSLLSLVNFVLLATSTFLPIYSMLFVDWNLHNPHTHSVCMFVFAKYR